MYIDSVSSFPLVRGYSPCSVALAVAGVTTAALPGQGTSGAAGRLVQETKSLGRERCFPIRRGEVEMWHQQSLGSEQEIDE